MIYSEKETSRHTRIFWPFKPPTYNRKNDSFIIPSEHPLVPQRKRHTHCLSSHTPVDSSTQVRPNTVRDLVTLTLCTKICFQCYPDCRPPYKPGILCLVIFPTYDIFISIDNGVRIGIQSTLRYSAFNFSRLERGKTQSNHVCWTAMVVLTGQTCRPSWQSICLTWQELVSARIGVFLDSKQFSAGGVVKAMTIGIWGSK
jgi:hypothetical protein